MKLEILDRARQDLIEGFTFMNRNKPVLELTSSRISTRRSSLFGFMAASIRRLTSSFIEH